MSTGSNYFYTGGGFSDWSGRSAGIFSGGSSSGGDNGYGVPIGYTSQEKKKEWIENEKRHGLHRDTDDYPKFISTSGLVFRIIGCLLLQMTSILSMLAFFNVPNETEAKIITAIWVFAVNAVTWYISTKVKDWYPVPRKQYLTKEKLGRFLKYQDLVKIGCSMLCLFFALTPLWRYLIDGYVETLNVEKYSEIYYHYSHFHLDTSHIVGMVIMGMFALMPFFSVLIWPLSTKSTLDSRWQYMRYKMGILDKAEKDRLEKVADLEKLLEQKKKEVAELLGQIFALKNNINV